MSQQKNVEHSTLSSRLRNSRESRGYSMRKLSRESGVDVGYISKIEDGKNANLGSDKARSLAGALSVSVDWLLHGLGERTPAPNEGKEAPAPYIVSGEKRDPFGSEVRKELAALQDQVAVLMRTVENQAATIERLSRGICKYPDRATKPGPPGCDGESESKVG